MKCNHPDEAPACAFHYNGICTRDHNYECPALAMKNLSHGEMVQIAEGKKNKTPRYIDANRLIDLATHEGAYGYVDIHDIYNIPTADVVERKKGRWLNKGRKMCCSVCGRTNFCTPNFCDECGTDMREEKSDAH